MLKTLFIIFILIQVIYLLVKGLTLLTYAQKVNILQMFKPIKTDSLLNGVQGDSFCSLAG